MGEGSNQFGRVGGYWKTSIEAGLGQSDKASKSLFQILTFQSPASRRPVKWKIPRPLLMGSIKPLLLLGSALSLYLVQHNAFQVAGSAVRCAASGSARSLGR